MRFLLLPAAILMLAGVDAQAQCTVSSVTFQSYGSGCSPVFQPAPTLAGKFDPSTCTMALSLDGFPGCCNTYLWDKLFIVGTRAINVPVPFIGQGCTLLATLDVVVALPRGSGDTLTVPLPPGIPGVTLLSQGVNHYFTTIGFSHDFTMSQGLAITIR